MPERFPRIRRKGRRWTHRLWWMRAAAASLDLAALCRRMGPPARRAPLPKDAIQGPRRVPARASPAIISAYRG